MASRLCGMSLDCAQGALADLLFYGSNPLQRASKSDLNLAVAPERRKNTDVLTAQQDKSACVQDESPETRTVYISMSMAVQYSDWSQFFIRDCELTSLAFTCRLAILHSRFKRANTIIPRERQGTPAKTILLCSESIAQ